jgi:hypothetical protein
MGSGSVVADAETALPMLGAAAGVSGKGSTAEPPCADADAANEQIIKESANGLMGSPRALEG